MTRTARITVAGLVLALLGAPTVMSRAAQSTVPTPTVEGPIEGGTFGRPQTDSRFDLTPYGYVEEEYFISGTARSYTAAPSTAPYKTRIVVRRPTDRRRFNGTTIVEWNNVTAQFDNTPDWLWAHETILREGFAYVHVSAQAAGHCCFPLSLKVADGPRYGSLSHPGDDYSFDIFSQAVQAIHRRGTDDPMGGLKTKRVIAAGHSQSAGRLSTYVSTVHDQARVIDGFLIDGGGKRAADAPPPGAPIINVLEEFGMSAAEPQLHPNYRVWEVAGAAHTDYWILRHEFDTPDHVLVPGHEPYPAGWDEREHEEAGNYGYDIEARQATCVVGGNMFPKRYAVSAAVVRLDEWIRTGATKVKTYRAEYSGMGTPAVDEHGNTMGGLRLPPIDVPVATYVGQSCGLFGNTIPFDAARLHVLYPTHEDYVAKMQKATDAAVGEGVLLPADAADLMDRARRSSIPLQGVRSPVPPHVLDVPAVSP